MSRKIAVIVTELLKDFTDSILKKFSDRFSYRIFTYHVFEDIPQIAQQITEEFDGILTSGSFPAHMLKLSCPTERRPVAFFNTDDAALFRLLLKLLEQNRQLDFHRVYADIVELFGVSLADFIEGKASLPDITALSDEDFSLERMRQVEKEQYEKHLSLWMEGKTDLSISRLSSIVPALKEAGVNVYFPYPSEKYVQGICLSLLQEIELLKLRETIPGIVILKPEEPKGPKPFSSSLDYSYNQLENLVIEFINSSMINISVQRRRYGLEIVASKKELALWTQDFQEDSLRDFIGESLSCHIGYGTGSTLAQARLNALNACLESAQKGCGSYFINEGDQLIGPLGTAGRQPVMVVGKELPSGLKSALSPLTIQKIYAAFNASEKKELTARELALFLGITKRSANRFLTVLTQEGWLRVAYKTRSTTKGRPEGVYVWTEKSLSESQKT